MSEKMRIDERDAKLLQLIDLKGRTTYAALAKALRISKPAVKRRLERLEEAGVIRRYIAIINLPKLGYNAYKLSLKLTGMDDEDLKRFADHAHKMKEAGWVLSCIGRWDLLVIVYARGASQLNMLYRQLITPIVGQIAHKQVSVLASFTHLSHDCLVRDRPASVRQQVTIGGPLETVQLDELDLKLLDAVSHDARASLVKLAAALSVTPKTVRTRLKRLEREDIILGYNAVLETEKLGLEHHKVHVYLSDLSDRSYRQVRGWITSLPETVLFTEAVSNSDLDFDVKVPTTTRLHEIVQVLRSRFKGLIKDVQTLLVTDEDVFDYTPYR